MKSAITIFVFVVSVAVTTMAADNVNKACDDKCPLIYSPVCAGPRDSTPADRPTLFDNDCVFKFYNCHNALDWELKSNEKCPGMSDESDNDSDSDSDSVGQ